MNINPTSFRKPPVQIVSSRIVISISNRLMADGLKSLLVERGYDVGVFDQTADFATLSETEVNSVGLDRIVWMLDTKTVLTLVPSSKREMIRKRTILIADIHPARKSRAYLANAATIVSTESSFQELDFAVRAVCQGNRYFDQRLSHFRVEEFNGAGPALTARQMQVLRMVAEGMSSRKIATELLLSRRTVENHRARILERLGVNTAAEMIDIARDRNWI